jgi:hypothetical protein
VRRGNFNQDTNRRRVIAGLGLDGVRFHDLRHSGNTLRPGASRCGLGKGWRAGTVDLDLG